MEMLDWSLLVTTFSKQIWPLHNSATRVTSMESPSKENPADVAMQRSCQTAGAQNRPPAQVRKHACSAKSGLARKAAGEAFRRAREEAGIKTRPYFPANEGQ